MDFNDDHKKCEKKFRECVVPCNVKDLRNKYVLSVQSKTEWVIYNDVKKEDDDFFSV